MTFSFLPIGEHFPPWGVFSIFILGEHIMKTNEQYLKPLDLHVMRVNT